MKFSQFFHTVPVFTHAEAVRVHTAGGASERTTNNLLAHHVRTGRLVRVRRGVYATVPHGVAPDRFTPDPYLVATKLAGDSTVAYHAALEFHGRAYSTWRRFHYLTARRARPLRYRDFELIPVLAPAAVRSLPDLGGGVVERPYAGGTVRVTTLERALVDVLDAPDHGGGWEEIWRSLELVEFFDLDAVIDYAHTLGSSITVARVGYFLEQHRDELMVEARHLDALRAHAPSQVRYFDSKRATGRLVAGWNLVVPDAVLNKAWEEPFDAD